VRLLTIFPVKTPLDHIHQLEIHRRPSGKILARSLSGRYQPRSAFPPPDRALHEHLDCPEQHGQRSKGVVGCASQIG
jgi:hypothetical protein